MRPIRIGLVGAGCMGQRHLKSLSNRPNAEVRGLIEPDESRARELHQKGYRIFSSYAELLSECEAVCIASPTPTHHAYAAEALRQGKHVFIEKPVVTSARELEDLLRLAEEAGTVTMVGHVERLNPAFRAILPWASEVTMVQLERLAPFTPRGSEVSVLLDLLVHDLDLIWQLWRRMPSHFQAIGASSFTRELDCVQAWLSFPGGSTASFLVSRNSPLRLRRAILMGPACFLEVNLLTREARGWKLQPEPTPLSISPSSYPDALQEEMDQFLQAIHQGIPSPIPIEDVQPVMEWAWHLERLAWRALGVPHPSERL